MAATLNPYINIYSLSAAEEANAATAQGTAISNNNTQTDPLSVTVNSSQTDSSVITCCVIRCQTGYQTAEGTTTTISFTGTTNNLWKISKTKNGTYSDRITYDGNSSDGIITTSNKVFYIKTEAAAGETPTIDTSVSIVVEATIAATA